MRRILVVDDDAEIRAMIRAMLEYAGYEVAVANDGNMGIRVYKQKGADVIITDLLMKGKGGIEMISELKRDFPDIKIIAISGKAYLDLASDLGALRTLSKPIAMKELLTAVRDLISQ